MIYFITGSKFKLAEAKAILGDDKIEGIDIDLPEIQEIDPHKIINEKLKEAFKHHKGPFIVEDTSLYMEALGKDLPGPLIKWFMKTIGNTGLSNIAKKIGKDGARAVTLIGYAKNRDEIKFFKGENLGKIVDQMGSSDFGWEPIFIPEGYNKTFAEMSPAEKNKISMRRLAFEKLKKYLKL